MIIRQMHIEIEGQLSQVNAGVRRTYHPEEIDMALNVSIPAFAHARIKQWASGDQQSVEDIASLVVTDHYMQCYRVAPQQYRVILPANRFEMGKVRFLGKRLCGAEPPDATVENKTVYRLKMPRTTKATPPYYETLTLEDPPTVFFDIKDTPGWGGIPDKDSYFTLYDQLYFAARENGIYVEGETLWSFRPFWVRIDGFATAAQVQTTSFTYYKGLQDIIYADPVSPLHIQDLLNTPFYGPSLSRIIYHMTDDNNLAVYTPPGIILDKAIATYFRKPVKTDVILGVNCDLPDNGKVHELLCTIAVRKIMGETGDERYPVKAGEEAKQANNNR